MNLESLMNIATNTLILLVIIVLLALIAVFLIKVVVFRWIIRVNYIIQLLENISENIYFLNKTISDENRINRHHNLSG